MAATWGSLINEQEKIDLKVSGADYDSPQTRQVYRDVIDSVQAANISVDGKLPIADRALAWATEFIRTASPSAIEDLTSKLEQSYPGSLFPPNEFKRTLTSLLANALQGGKEFHVYAVPRDWFSRMKPEQQSQVINLINGSNLAPERSGGSFLGSLGNAFGMVAGGLIGGSIAGPQGAVAGAQVGGGLFQS